MKNLACLLLLAVVISVACGGGNGEPSSDVSDGSGSTSDVTAQSSDEVQQGQDVDSQENETVCRANMEALAMMLLTVKGSRGSLPGSLEEFQAISPAYAEMTVDCGGTPYIYATDGESFTITCPNGHGYITDDQASWSW